MDILASDSTSDLEFAAQSTPSYRQPSWTRASRGFGLFAGLAVVVMCAVAMMYAPARTDQPSVIVAPKLGSLSGLVQAYAVQRSGHALTDVEVDALYSHLAGGGHPKARALLDRFSHHEQDVHGTGLSQACEDAIADKLADVFAGFASLLVDAVFDCVLGDEEGEGCAATSDDMDSFLDDTTSTCKAARDYCNISVAGIDDGQHVEESQAICVPAACHAEAQLALKLLKEQVGEAMREDESDLSKTKKPADDCENCTISIACPQTAGHAEKGVEPRGEEEALEIVRRKE